MVTTAFPSPYGGKVMLQTRPRDPKPPTKPKVKPPMKPLLKPLLKPPMKPLLRLRPPCPPQTLKRVLRLPQPLAQPQA